MPDVGIRFDPLLAGMTLRSSRKSLAVAQGMRVGSATWKGSNYAHITNCPGLTLLKISGLLAQFEFDPTCYWIVGSAGGHKARNSGGSPGPWEFQKNGS